MKRIFVISRQKCGTTSTAGFFRHHGFDVCEADGKYSKLWTLYHYSSRHDEIFTSPRFQRNQVFEDEPWWRNGCLEVLINRFPEAYYVLIKRDSNSWFESLRKHRSRKKYFRGFDALEYGLELELAEYLDKNRETVACGILEPNEFTRNHYLAVYEKYHEMVECLLSEHGILDRCFIGSLEDPLLWKKLGFFFGIPVADSFFIHENKARK